MLIAFENRTAHAHSSGASHHIGIGGEELSTDPNIIIQEQKDIPGGNSSAGIARLGRVWLILTMPEDMSIERRRLLARLGAELILTPALEGMTGAVYLAQPRRLLVSCG